MSLCGLLELWAATMNDARFSATHGMGAACCKPQEPQTQRCFHLRSELIRCGSTRPFLSAALCDAKVSYLSQAAEQQLLSGILSQKGHVNLLRFPNTPVQYSTGTHVALVVCSPRQ